MSGVIRDSERAILDDGIYSMVEVAQDNINRKIREAISISEAEEYTKGTLQQLLKDVEIFFASVSFFHEELNEIYFDIEEQKLKEEKEEGEEKEELEEKEEGEEKEEE